MITPEPKQGTTAIAATVIAELSRRAALAETGPRSGSYKDALEYVILRDALGKERVEYLSGRLPDPGRKTGTVKLNDAASFISYYKLHGQSAPIYACMEPAQFVAVLNDHTIKEAGWRDHRAVFTIQHSREWNTWVKHNGAGQAFGSNEAFAFFLEDNSLDIVNPAAAQMLEIALNFRVNADVSFATSQRLQDGHVELGYSNMVSATGGRSAAGKVNIPELFTIEIPIFAGISAAKYSIDVRFRYRLRDGKLTLWYDLVQPRRVVEKAFKDLWDKIADETQAPLLHGTPE